MKKRTLKVMLPLLLSIIIATTAIIPSSALSTWTWIDVNNIKYKCQCTGEANSATVSSTVRIQTRDNYVVPTNYIAGLAMLYNANNQLVSSSGVTYNSLYTNTMSVYTTKSIPGSYNARGMALFFTGEIEDGSWVYEGLNLEDPVSIYFPSSSSSPSYASPTYNITNDGKTYGTCELAERYEEYPDLISAVGDNGASGYVGKTDLFYIAKSPKDAVEYTENVDGSSIPVYDLNGNVIDQFTFSGGCTYESVG